MMKADGCAIVEHKELVTLIAEIVKMVTEHKEIHVVMVMEYMYMVYYTCSAGSWK